MKTQQSLLDFEGNTKSLQALNALNYKFLKESTKITATGFFDVNLQLFGNVINKFLHKPV